jgi:hypothetical protein
MAMTSAPAAASTPVANAAPKPPVATNPSTSPNAQVSTAVKQFGTGSVAGGGALAGRPPLVGTGGSGAQPAPQPQGNGLQDQASQMWADMLTQSDQGLNDTIKGTYADEALNQRRNAEMNAAAGGGVGGAFIGGMAQAQIGGEQARVNARSQHTKDQLNMKMAYLDKLIRQAEASNDRDLQRELQAEADNTQIQLASMGMQQSTAEMQAQADAMNPTPTTLDDLYTGPALKTKEQEVADRLRKGL